jgi:putative glutamine amidotransferase
VRPLIGITTASITNENGLTYNRAYQPISQAVEHAGGLPVLIPTGIDDETLRAIYEHLDAVLLPGGPDIDPSHYGEEPHPTTKVDSERDAIEVPLVRWAVEDDLPLFGICRGHQVINVALGGSLIQDIPSQIDERVLPHATPDDQPRNRPTHDVSIAPESRLSSIMGGTSVAVNSLHHQAVREAAPGMRITAYSPDGLVEATELPGKRFALSVQWHPEDLYENDDTMLRLFEEFVEAARERALRRSGR